MSAEVSGGSLLRSEAGALGLRKVFSTVALDFDSDLNQVRLLAGVAEQMPLAPASVDVLVCAQAFHWFATPAALADMHRVLKPGGRLGLVWNCLLYTSPSPRDRTRSRMPSSA